MRELRLYFFSANYVIIFSTPSTVLSNTHHTVSGVSRYRGRNAKNSQVEDDIHFSYII